MNVGKRMLFLMWLAKKAGVPEGSRMPWWLWWTHNLLFPLVAIWRLLDSHVVGYVPDQLAYKIDGVYISLRTFHTIAHAKTGEILVVGRDEYAGDTFVYVSIGYHICPRCMSKVPHGASSCPKCKYDGRKD